MIEPVLAFGVDRHNETSSGGGGRRDGGVTVPDNHHAEQASFLEICAYGVEVELRQRTVSVSYGTFVSYLPFTRDSRSALVLGLGLGLGFDNSNPVSTMEFGDQLEQTYLLFPVLVEFSLWTG